MNRAVIGVGSNIEPRQNVEAFRKIVRQRFQYVRASRFVETKAIGRHEQANYLNGAFLIKTSLTRRQLHSWLRTTERALGRVRTSDKYAARTIDLDILVWNGEVVDPDVRERGFLQRAIEELLPGEFNFGGGLD